MITLSEVKASLKGLAQEIRELKNTRKSRRNGYVPGLSAKQFQYRWMHIAYCMARGRTYEQIEQKTNIDPYTKHRLETHYKALLYNILLSFNKKEDSDDNEAVCGD